MTIPTNSPDLPLIEVAYYEEVGVWYRHSPSDSSSHVEYTPCTYTAHHRPTNTTHDRKVWVLGGEAKFHRLLTHWNRTDDWHFVCTNLVHGPKPSGRACMSRWTLMSLLFTDGTAWVEPTLGGGIPKRSILQSVERESGSGKSFNLRLLDPDTNTTYNVCLRITD